jgi:simple sugar transport system permease protein
MAFEFDALLPLALGLTLAVWRASTPILFAALGGLLSELVGCINVALEGQMLLAAFAAVMCGIYLARWFPGLPPWLLPWLACLAGLAAATALGAMLALFHLEGGADLVVAGVALNLLASGLTVFLLAQSTGDKGSSAGLFSPVLPGLPVPGLDGWPGLHRLFNGDDGAGHHVLQYLALASLPILSFYLYQTRAGRWLRATGAHAGAARLAAIPVQSIRYRALLASAALAGLAGVFLSMGYLNLFQADMTAGRGMLGLAAVYVGGCRLWGVAGAALLFGAASVLASRLGGTGLPVELSLMLPPLITIGALLVRRRHHNAGDL